MIFLYQFFISFLLLGRVFTAASADVPSHDMSERTQMAPHLPGADSLTNELNMVTLLSQQIDALENQQQLMSRTLYDLMNQQNYRFLQTNVLCFVVMDSTANIKNTACYYSPTTSLEKDFQQLLLESVRNLQIRYDNSWKRTFTNQTLVFEIKIKWNYAGGQLEEIQDLDNDIQLRKKELSRQNAVIVMPIIAKEI